ncbi:hypothetical protein BDP27DRAFT_1369046 [Rhodocollybia butyracea]|uniref:Uncharacterized protein n=1 Tax=Rhodocollybia butyracea TaxID=206335 RepID=A0A9P5U027_9AGAR|nr:hypothetical protein BDP27DRAFT_1369046 [Rhodocollybia butyracea]
MRQISKDSVGYAKPLFDGNVGIEIDQKTPLLTAFEKLSVPLTNTAILNLLTKLLLTSRCLDRYVGTNYVYDFGGLDGVGKVLVIHWSDTAFNCCTNKMGLDPGKVIPIRLKKSNCDLKANGSIIAANCDSAISTDVAVTHDAIMDRSNNMNVVLVDSVDAAIPVARTPLKAIIHTLLVMLGSIKTWDKNRGDAACLIQRLHLLDGAISAALPATSQILYRRNALARRLDKILGRLKRLHVNSFHRSLDIKHAILECISEIDQHFVMSIKYWLSIQAACMRLTNPQQFMKCYLVDTNRAEALLNFLTHKTYKFYIEDGTRPEGASNSWTGGWNAEVSSSSKEEADDWNKGASSGSTGGWNKETSSSSKAEADVQGHEEANHSFFSSASDFELNNGQFNSANNINQSHDTIYNLSFQSGFQLGHYSKELKLLKMRSNLGSLDAMITPRISMQDCMSVVLFQHVVFSLAVPHSPVPGQMTQAQAIQRIVLLSSGLLLFLQYVGQSL